MASLMRFCVNCGGSHLVTGFGRVPPCTELPHRCECGAYGHQTRYHPEWYEAIHTPPPRTNLTSSYPGSTYGAGGNRNLGEEDRGYGGRGNPAPYDQRGYREPDRRPSESNYRSRSPLGGDRQRRSSYHGRDRRVTTRGDSHSPVSRRQRQSSYHGRDRRVTTRGNSHSPVSRRTGDSRSNTAQSNRRIQGGQPATVVANPSFNSTYIEQIQATIDSQGWQMSNGWRTSAEIITYDRSRRDPYLRWPTEGLWDEEQIRRMASKVITYPFNGNKRRISSATTTAPRTQASNSAQQDGGLDCNICVPTVHLASWSLYVKHTTDLHCLPCSRTGCKRDFVSVVSLRAHERTCRFLNRKATASVSGTGVTTNASSGLTNAVTPKTEDTEH